MPEDKRQQTLTYIITFVTILVALTVTYSLSSGTPQRQTENVPSQTSTARLSFQSSIIDDNVLLVKDDKLIIGKTGLDYKGLNKKSIFIDLYLLDLDAEQPYTKKISKKSKGKQVRLGNYTYEVVSIKEKYMRMKILEEHSSL